ncbi:MAG: hypothetical protein J7494_11005 [Sphingobium sp.]|nr:hypothetical protein [Sphingobium sp.]
MSYTIEVQNDPPLLRVSLSGFWTMDIFNAYMRDCGTAIGALVARHGRFDTLGDCTDFQIQGPEVSAAFEHLKAKSDKTPQNRIALYSAKALSRMQAERTVGNAHSKVFSSEAAALKWLGLA